MRFVIFFIATLSLAAAVPDRRIVNGEEATPGQFPYHALIYADWTNGMTMACGGAVISANYVMTAAHCLQPSNGGVVILGAHYRLYPDEPSQQRFTFSADDMNYHPGFTFTHIRNNIGVIRIRDGIQLNDRVQPVKLPARSDGRTFAGMMGTVTGFGGTSDEHNEMSPVLRYALNPIMTNADCLEAADNNVNLIQDQNICQSGANGRGSCNNDSGGPLTVQHEGSSMQVGIVSFGSTVCKDGTPTGFTRVSYFLDWIEENTDVVIDP